MHRAAPAASPGENLLERTERPRSSVASDEPHAGEPAPPEPGEELAPGVRRLGVSLGAADDLPVAGRVDADGDRRGRVLVGSSPAALEADAVDENEGVVAIERHQPSGPDGREVPLVEVGDGAGGHRRPPKELGDALDPPGRDAHEVQLDDGLLDRGQAPTVAPGPDELRRLLVEQRVERLLDGLPHQIIYVLAQRFFVD